MTNGVSKLGKKKNITKSSQFFTKEKIIPICVESSTVSSLSEYESRHSEPDESPQKKFSSSLSAE